jgi:hypothetical protein
MSTTLQTRGQVIAALPVNLRASAEAFIRSGVISPSGRSPGGDPLFSARLVKLAVETTAAEARAAKDGRHRVAAKIPGLTRSASGEVNAGGIQFSL